MTAADQTVTIIGFVVTWLAWIFSMGVAYGKLSSKLAAHDVDINIIKDLFVDGNNEPRLITYPAHDIMVRQCHENIDLKISAITKSNDEVREQVRKLGDTMQSEMKIMSQALQKISLDHATHSHRRKTDMDTDGVF